MFTNLQIPTVLPTACHPTNDNNRLDYFEMERGNDLIVVELWKGCPNANFMGEHKEGDHGYFLRISQSHIIGNTAEASSKDVNAEFSAIIEGPINSEEVGSELLDKLRQENENYIVG